MVLSQYSRQPRPPVPSTEELEELSDDAIVSQQSAAHAPPTRANVVIEDQSVVVADLPPEIDPSEVMATRQLSAYPGSRDPTMLIQRAPPPPPPSSRTNWLIVAIWLLAGLLAFAFGGVLALLSARNAATPAPAPVSPAQPATPAP